ncbi:MAG TPA: hypothetical protein VFP10_05010, partial [Candidatus Eisenbacteria bacterium]|nr:hypothetical protein [Candidatus Eisenbacteria bacterium]
MRVASSSLRSALYVSSGMLIIVCGCSDSSTPDPGPDCSSVADTTQPATVSYVNDIVPLFFPEKYSCLNAPCHGGGFASSNYALTSYAEVLKAGDQAKQLDMCAVKPGDPDA